MPLHFPEKLPNYQWQVDFSNMDEKHKQKNAILQTSSSILKVNHRSGNQQQQAHFYPESLANKS